MATPNTAAYGAAQTLAKVIRKIKRTATLDRDALLAWLADMASRAQQKPGGLGRAKKMRK
jgi:hypothetical protein